SFVIFNHDYLEEALGRPGMTSAYWIKADSAGSVPTVIQMIDEMFNNTDAPTKTETERAFSMGVISMLGNLNVLITAITGTIIFAILLVTANTMAMSVRERAREIAVLKSLGFRRGKIMRLLISEGMLITICGGLIGAILARYGFSSVNLALYTQGLVQNLEVGWPVIGFGILVSALLGLVSAGIPAYRAVRMIIADGLRHVG
ncbi:MAG TPA: FtsX-like permease family protein, partial [Blastocatellia bacterium]